MESQHRNSNEVVPDPFSSRPNIKEEKAVWLRETKQQRDTESRRRMHQENPERRLEEQQRDTIGNDQYV